MKLLQCTAFCLLATAFVCLTACKNTPNDAAKNTPSVTGEKTATPNTFYKHFRGKIGDFPVTMDIVQNIITENSGFQQLKGYYTYDKYQEPIALIGDVAADGTWTVTEYARDGSSAELVGKWSNGIFAGTWRDTTNKKTFPFTLTEDYSDGALKFDYQSFMDSVAMVKSNPKSPVAHFELHSLIPQITEGGAGWLKNEIFKTWSADTFGQVGTALLPLDQAKTKRRDEFFKDYVEGNADFMKDTADWGVVMNWMMSYGMNVLSNTADRVSLEYTNYWYTGGAHGNYGSSLVTYDLKTQKVITLNDVFKPNYQKMLNAALAKSVRKTFNLKPNEPLSNVLFENAIEANDNFCVTSKGILFNYTPYEIAAYAAGEIQLFVPFEEIKGILK
jgi:Protein of unknown function (DUF3298)/Deacetylase PdaC